MSLAVLADHMASKGRGGDSMLIHMAPQEIAGLQALAVANGGSLTTNPDTGLPEALSLKKLLPAIIGFGLNYFVPGLGSAVGSALGTSAAVGTGVAVGGFEALRTGDLGKGISAGLGAYGGAGLQTSLAGAGSSAIGSEAARAATGLTNDMAFNLADAGSSLSNALAGGETGILESSALSNEAIKGIQQQAAAERIAAASPFERMTAGLDAAKAAPGTFLKDNFKYLAAGAAPILADQAVKSNLPTTTTKPGIIRPYSFDPYGGTYTAGTPYEAMPKSAANGGLMSMDNGGYSPGQLDFTQQSEPVVRMADGGYTDQQVKDWFLTNKGATDQQIADAMQTFKVGTDQIARATGTQGQEADYNTRFVKAVATPATDTGEFMKAANAVGLQNQALANALQTSGLSQGAQYALTHQNIGPDVNKAETQGGLEGLSSNINYLANLANTQIGAGTLTAAQARENALTEMNKYGLNEADVLRATGKTVAELFKDKAVAPTCGFGMRLNAAGTACEQIICGTGFQLNKAGTACEAITKVDDKKTLTCGDGMEPNAAGTACVPITKKCEDGYHLSTDGKTCIPNAPVIIDWQPCATGYHWDKAQQACVVNVNAVQDTTTTVDTSTGLITAPATALPVGVSGNTGASIIGGGSTVNPNGTITTSPVIPGIPVGGFTGMEQLRDAYEKGGGSLGVNKNLFVPKTQDELFARYKNTGGSKAAFDYLMGKTPYSPVPVTPTGEIMKPYWESVGRAPINLKAKKYIFKDGKYELNPDYVKPSYVQAGEKKAADKAAGLTNKDTRPTTDPGAGNDWVWNTTDSKWEAKPISSSSNASSESSSGTGGDANGGLMRKAVGGLAALTMAGGGMSGQFDLGGYSDGGRLLRGPGDGVSDSIPATIGNKRPARLADGEFVVPARIVSELGNGSTEAGARKLYAMMDRVQRARRGTVGKGRVAKNSRADKHLPA